MEAYYGELEKIKGAVESYFLVEDVFYESGVLTFHVADEEIKEKFKHLYKELKELGYIPTAKREEGRVVIRIFRYRERFFSPLKYKNLPLILFAATLAMITVDGYLRASSPIYELVFGKLSTLDKIGQALVFTASLMLIIGLHELGHLIAAKKSGMEATLPYFIPGIPGIMPTFGAVVFQKEPIVNRDEMFDLGISGPLMSFILSILVMILAIKTSVVWMTPAEYNKTVQAVSSAGGVFLPSPLIIDLLIYLFRVPGKLPFAGGVVVFAAWLGFFITALNLFPIWQLDGSKVFRSVLNPRQHRIANYVSLLILAVAGYIVFALLLLLLMSKTPDIPPLDEASPLSRGRKIAFIAVIPMIILCLPIFFPPL